MLISYTWLILKYYLKFKISLFYRVRESLHNEAVEIAKAINKEFIYNHTCLNIDEFYTKLYTIVYILTYSFD